MGEFFDVFPFALKSVQFMNEVFPLFLEEPELNVSVAEAKFWIVFLLSALSASNLAIWSSFIA